MLFLKSAGTGGGHGSGPAAPDSSGCCWCGCRFAFTDCFGGSGACEDGHGVGAAAPGSCGCCCSPSTNGCAKTSSFHHRCSIPSFLSHRTTRASSSSSPPKLNRSCCSVRSEVHVNGHEHVFCCSGWCSNDLAAFSLDGFCIKWVWLDGGPIPFCSCLSSCARLASAASCWSCNSHTTSYARLCISTPYCWIASVPSVEQASWV